MSTRSDSSPDIDLDRLRRVEDKVTRLEERGKATGDRQDEILARLQDLARKLEDNNASIQDMLKAHRDELRSSTEARQSELEARLSSAAKDLELRMNRAHEELEQRIGKVEDEQRPRGSERTKTFWLTFSAVFTVVCAGAGLIANHVSNTASELKVDAKATAAQVQAIEHDIDDQLAYQKTYAVYLRGEVRRVMDQLKMTAVEEPVYSQTRSARRKMPATAR